MWSWAVPWISPAFYLFINCHVSVTVTWSFEACRNSVLQSLSLLAIQPGQLICATAVTSQLRGRQGTETWGPVPSTWSLTVPVCPLGYLVSVSPAVPGLFGTRDRLPGRQFFHWPGSGGWFQDDWSTLHLLYALLLRQLRLRSSGIRSWRLGTPVLVNSWAFCWCLSDPTGNIWTLSRSTFTW